MKPSPTLPFEVTHEVRENCLCLHVQRAARVLARRYDAALRPAGVTNGQFSLLMSLNRESPPNIKEVSDLLGMDQTTLTANLKPLARRGLLAVMVDDADKRSRRIALTKEGRKALAKALPLWRAAQIKTGRLSKRSGRARMLEDLAALESV
jgi:DNA-binding MarR family transcriptional regulator